MLSPHQARRVRPIGGDEASWRDVTAETLDVRRLYRCNLPSGAAIDIVFRDAAISQGLAFGELLRDGGALVERLRTLLARDDDDALVCAATDGETFGHHHQFGEMAIAYTIESLRRDPGVSLLGPAAFRALSPPRDELEIVPDSSWSCAHGVERWRSDCGCRVAGPPAWTQAWRAPLRAAIDWLRDELAVVFERETAGPLRDPWGARDRYVDCVVEPDRTHAFLEAELRPGATRAEVVTARRGLEMARHAMLMQTSCGWFFDDLAGVEGTLVLRQAGRALDLARRLGTGLEEEFLDRLVAARSNVEAEGSGADVYGRVVLGRRVTPERIAATAVVLDRLGERPTLPGYTVTLRPEGEHVDVEVDEERTGGRDVVRVRPPAPSEPFRCEVDGVRYGVTELFLVQRERLLARITGDAVERVRSVRHEVLARVAAIIDPLLAREPVPSLELAMMLGYDEADRLATAVATDSEPLAGLKERMAVLRARGVVVPARVVGRILAPRLNAALERLPEGVGDALAVLDVADAAAVVLDMGPAQVAVARWWQTACPAAPDESLVRLRDRLGLSPELGSLEISGRRSTMARVAVRDELVAPIERVWACFADFGDLSAWAPGRTRVPVEGHGVGAVRTVAGDDAPTVRERLEAYDPAGHSFSYAMLESPFPFTDYLATVELRDLGGGRTSIDWSSTFEPRGIPTEEVARLIEGIYRMFIARLKETLGA
ncbi:MAG TPA: DUF3536 domain-containing protein, partial [Candidatus Eisenbacteria bacterium]|nr:DUF3536 domain-containing protein [Candidatus Eisenbacteria bacterium]